VYQLHLYVTISQDDAVRAGINRAGTYALPLTAEQVTEIRDLGLTDAAEAYLDGSERGKIASDRNLPVIAPTWDAARAALSERRALIERCDALLATAPSWEAACEIADRASHTEYNLDNPPARLSARLYGGCWLGSTRASVLVYMLANVVASSRVVLEGGEPDYTLRTETDAAPWLPPAVISALRTYSEAGEIARKAGEIAREEREAAARIALSAARDQLIADHGDAGTRQRHQLGLLPDTEVDDLAVRVALTTAGIVLETHAPRDGGSVVTEISARDWEIVRAVVDAVSAVDPDPEIWHCDDDDDDAWSVLIAVPTRIGTITREILI
jgi:hypothetical protein